MKNLGRNLKKFFFMLRPIKNKSGVVTAETAIGLTTFSSFAVLAILMISYVSNALMITDAARTAARLVSRGESQAVVVNAVEVLAPGSTVTISYGLETALVEVLGPENPKAILYLPRIKSTFETYLESEW